MRALWKSKVRHSEQHPLRLKDFTDLSSPFFATLSYNSCLLFLIQGHLVTVLVATHEDDCVPRILAAITAHWPQRIPITDHRRRLALATRCMTALLAQHLLLDLKEFTGIASVVRRFAWNLTRDHIRITVAILCLFTSRPVAITQMTIQVPSKPSWQASHSPQPCEVDNDKIPWFPVGSKLLHFFDNSDSFMTTDIQTAFYCAFYIRITIIFHRSVPQTQVLTIRIITSSASLIVDAPFQQESTVLALWLLWFHKTILSVSY